MSVPDSSLFSLVATIPERPRGGDFVCRTRWQMVHELPDRQDGGRGPLLEVIDAGLTPDPGPDRPLVMRCALRFTTSAAAWTLHVDKALVSRCAEGDELHLANTSSGGVALSLVRGGQLVFAVGAVVASRLGQGITASVPYDLVDLTGAIYRTRSPGFRFAELPLEICVEGRCWIGFRGTRQLGDYTVQILHGVLDGEPDADACATIARNGACPAEALALSAQLLQRG